MELTSQHRLEFEQQGFTRLGKVFSEAEMAPAAQTLDRIHKDTPRFIGMLREPELMFLLHDERLEQIAKFMLNADAVVHSSNTSLYKPPHDHAPGEGWKMGSEHVDIMFSLEELDARPKRMTCMLMVLVSDLDEGQSNTFLRPGSHRMISEHFARQGLAPHKATPTALKDLPALDWLQPVPISGKRGEVIAFSTCVIHAGSTNITDRPRHMVFSNFCPLGMIKEVSGNHDRWEGRDEYRAFLRTMFPPDRHHLLLDSFKS